MPNLVKQQRRFVNFGLWTIAAVYLLILVGGLVRATGSGMGCPDWPKCFGKLVPPTEVSQLPSNYREAYAAKRKAKNMRIADFMSAIGFPEVHDKIVADAGVYVAEEFNAIKTWIEYINRLLGAVIGLLILLLVLFSWPLRRLGKGVFSLSLAGLFLTLVQAFLGSIVVSTNLIPATVTFHMLFSLVMLWFLMLSVMRSDERLMSPSSRLRVASGWAVLLSTIQVLLGTQVREDVDHIKANEDVIHDALASLMAQGPWLELHRVFAFVVTISTFYVFWRLYKEKAPVYVNFAAQMAVASVLLAMLSGIVLAYFNLPAFAQPIHLTLGTLIVGCHLWIFTSTSARKVAGLPAEQLTTYV